MISCSGILGATTTKTRVWWDGCRVLDPMALWNVTHGDSVTWMSHGKGECEEEVVEMVLSFQKLLGSARLQYGHGIG